MQMNISIKNIKAVQCIIKMQHVSEFTKIAKLMYNNNAMIMQINCNNDVTVMQKKL